jgi:hypothetical protein
MPMGLNRRELRLDAFNFYALVVSQLYREVPADTYKRLISESTDSLRETRQTAA